jgi:hypothetical protein
MNPMRVIPTSFLQFIYPFSFDSDQFDVLVRRVDGLCWETDKGDIQPWEATGFPREDLLANVGEFLNPIEEGSKKAATAFIWQLRRNEALDSYHGLGARARWSLRIGSSRWLPFTWESVRLALFRHGIGFVVLEVRPGTEESDGWLDFLHHFRFSAGSRACALEAQRQVAREQWEAYWPPVAARTGYEGPHTLHDVLNGLLSGPFCGRRRRDEVAWNEVFVPGQLIPHAVLLLETGSEEKEEDDLLYVYRVRNAFHSRQALHPAAEDLSPEGEGVLAYADRAWFTFALDGGGFVAFDPPATEFFRRDLPAHLRQQYFFLFLLAHYQRFTLMQLTHDVAGEWVCRSYRRRLRRFRRLYDDLLDFEARGYFVQAMQREHHHRCFSRWVEVLQVPRLHAEVSTQLERMHQALTTQQRETLQTTIAVLGAIVAFPGLVFGFFGMNELGIDHITVAGLGGVAKGILAGAVGLVLGVAFVWSIPYLAPGLGNRRRRLRRGSRPYRQPGAP